MVEIAPRKSMIHKRLNNYIQKVLQSNDYFISYGDISINYLTKNQGETICQETIIVNFYYP